MGLLWRRSGVMPSLMELTVTGPRPRKNVRNKPTSPPARPIPSSTPCTQDAGGVLEWGGLFHFHFPYPFHLYPTPYLWHLFTPLLPSTLILLVQISILHNFLLGFVIVVYSLMLRRSLFMLEFNKMFHFVSIYFELCVTKVEALDTVYNSVLQKMVYGDFVLNTFLRVCPHKWIE